VEYIDLYYQHRIDTNVPIEETVSDSLSLSTRCLEFFSVCN
jgi:aryl-alcohol dehydrogenase-like predicted oxidoreductase